MNKTRRKLSKSATIANEALHTFTPTQIFDNVIAKMRTDICEKLVREEIQTDRDYIIKFRKNPAQFEGECGQTQIVESCEVSELVRCKDCKYWQDNNGGYPHDECRWGKGETPDSMDYCAFGERREP